MHCLTNQGPRWKRSKKNHFKLWNPSTWTFSLYFRDKKKVTQLILSLMWKVAYNEYKQIYPNLVFQRTHWRTIFKIHLRSWRWAHRITKGMRRWFCKVRKFWLDWRPQIDMPPKTFSKGYKVPLKLHHVAYVKY